MLNTLPPENLADPVHAQSVLDFWLADGLALGWPTVDMNKRWFGGGAALDQTIRQQFGPWVESAMAGGLQEWEQDATDGYLPGGIEGGARLALIILLDQFSRNVFRGTAQAFAGDARALRLVHEALAQGLDVRLPWVARVFLYMPLMHAEQLPLQEESVRVFGTMAAQAPAELQAKLTSNFDFAKKHRGIVARFGRFPYRNAVLGRESTGLELEFLQSGPRFGQ